MRYSFLSRDPPVAQEPESPSDISIVPGWTLGIAQDDECSVRPGLGLPTSQVGCPITLFLISMSMMYAFGHQAGTKKMMRTAERERQAQ